MEIEAMVRGEQYRDLRREAGKERLICQVRTGQHATQPGAWMKSKVKHIAGWFRANDRHLFLVYRPEKRGAL
jgi:hypothetical protein